MTTYALKAPAQSYRLPAWATMHNLEVAVGLLLLVLLAFAVLRLSKGGGKSSPVPAPAPKKSGGGGKLLLAVVAAVGGLLAWGHYKPAATGANAAPAPSPSPVPHPTPTVTRTVAPHAAPHLPSFAFLDHLTGTDWTVIAVVALLVAFAIVRPLLKRGD